MNYSTISRRQFLKYAAATSAISAGSGFLTGCGIDPVTGKKHLMMVSQQQEIGIDQKQSPFQFSSDYGTSQDRKVNNYISSLGRQLVPNVHRLDMPYNFHCVNATYVNAYAFPGGTIAVTRGVLLELDDEAQLAALLGHELGHVNARHAAEQMSKSQISSLLVAGLSIAASTQSSDLGQMTQQLGMLSQGLLLSKYSRDNEREADALGNEYMVKAGYPSRGFVGLMEMLDSLHKESANSVQVLFSTHPMSRDRLSAARQRQLSTYKYSKDYRFHRERYMDNIASLRKKAGGIKMLQNGEKHMAKKEYDKAQGIFKTALKTLNNDYTANVLMAKCLMARQNPSQAIVYTKKAKQLYPYEMQGYFVSGLANGEINNWSQAYQEFHKCDELLPGNPQMKFLKGYCQDKDGQVPPAAQNYINYLKAINYAPNKSSRYAISRLKKWGYAK